MEILGKRIQELRKENNLSQKELAEKIGVSDVAISRWERGTRIPNAENIVNLSNVFKISADYLLGIID
jgi:transcriptional regulator with XRE-family HTH domain